MSPGMIALLGAAATVGVGHTVLGPDHYVPFVVMAKARKWSVLRTGVITFLCGLGHVGSSVVLGAVGIAAGAVLANIELTESVRGDIAAWLLTAFGLVYMVWGTRRAIRNRPHAHAHVHADELAHVHEHVHDTEHAHPHEQPGKKSITPWVLFTIFVLGPCEPLIPMLMYPAAAESAWSVALVAGVFAVATISTMLVMSLVFSFALNRIPTGRFERYTHAMAGAAIFLCGIAIHMGL